MKDEIYPFAVYRQNLIEDTLFIKALGKPLFWLIIIIIYHHSIVRIL